jgi:hypothetical protein
VKSQTTHSPSQKAIDANIEIPSPPPPRAVQKRSQDAPKPDPPPRRNPTQRDLRIWSQDHTYDGPGRHSNDRLPIPAPSPFRHLRAPATAEPFGVGAGGGPGKGRVSAFRPLNPFRGHSSFRNFTLIALTTLMRSSFPVTADLEALRSRQNALITWIQYDPAPSIPFRVTVHSPDPAQKEVELLDSDFTPFCDLCAPATAGRPFFIPPFLL